MMMKHQVMNSNSHQSPEDELDVETLQGILFKLQRGMIFQELYNTHTHTQKIINLQGRQGVERSFFGKDGGWVRVNLSDIVPKTCIMIWGLGF